MSGNNTVTVAIIGGLGNQMFQYAAARALAISCGGEVELDLGFYRKARHRTFELDAFPIIATRRAPAQSGFWSMLRGPRDETQAPTYREPHFHFDPAFRELSLPVSIGGYFQSPRYFEDCADAIRRELTPPAARDSESLDVAQAMRAGDAAALHVRRGDYVESAKTNATHGTCSIDYYRRAMEQLPGDGPVFVFSDDIGWAGENLPAVRRLVFVGKGGNRSGLADLWLMTQAQHHIVANSSFSWWGAWLASRSDGTTLAPARWFADGLRDESDLVPLDWVRLAS